MIRRLGRRLLLAVAAVAGTGTAFAADDDTMRLGRFQPGEKADAAKDDTATLGGKDDDTELIRGYHGGGYHHGGYYGGGFYGRGYYGGGYYGGGFYGRSYYGGGFYGGYYGRPYYGVGFGVGYYRPSFGYSTYYAAPVYYSTPAYYSAPTYFSNFCAIGGASAPTVPLQLNASQAQPGQSFIPPAQVPQPMPPAGSYQYDGGSNQLPQPMPVPMSGTPRPTDDGVRVSLPVKTEPSKYKYAAYGEKK